MLTHIPSHLKFAKLEHLHNGRKIAPKRVIIETRELLYEPAVLQRVLSYAGLGHWFFIAAVSSLWRDLYSRLRPRMLQVYAPSGYKEEIICVAQMTLYSSVLQSASRVRLAHAHGLKFTKSFELAAGGYGTVEAVMTARELGLLLSSTTAQGAAGCSNMSVLQFLRARDVCSWDSTAERAAARRGNLTILQWLMEHGCHWNNGSILSEAASSGSLEMTAWVKQQPGVACNTQAMCEAACGGHTAVCEYLHAPGTQLPATVLLTGAMLTHCAGCRSTAVPVMTCLCACMLQKVAA
jgi:hypothetical protein